VKTRSRKPPARTPTSNAEERFAEVVDAFAADKQLAPIARAHREEQAQGKPAKFGAGALKVHGKIPS